MDIEQILDKIYPLSESSKLILKNHIVELSFPKNKILISADKIEKDFYFIKKGIARTFVYTDGDETTFSFGKEGDTIISMKSYIANQKGYENVELLEDCLVYKLNTQDIRKLYTENIEIANWGIKFAENELMKAEDRLLTRQFGTATNRYEILLKNYPNLLQRVQLGYIASYLGITQVSLSRIRANIK
ncbi:Crp/Fnr family transcriptional regulator [Chryseobacterium indoltheticum]|uniref:Predicted signal-transduction protein containing cAMP-binding and CBS domains n=1 Tax=Chryseobacterium indoltheticum TaxID=254 RepID=A0A381FF53_9FLAO|nr:Crp/Fnr family transcriptional regulator [Chryseobacterium indoltheticum]AZA74302.1 Crp/Fnr family transcriptional regulator [Chryseobacterium indoltheticum]SIQ01918.1 cAMP-binding domain of CRP or a regulatory subunit of cAMP-dependent protein kinases [Chryseobacterium indoltheticum]SUX45124.1 Predicted signal-transduction protein containing cAMP-binding and CBS domains [Chryseobacterium indoltheticum]